MQKFCDGSTRLVHLSQPTKDNENKKIPKTLDIGAGDPLIMANQLNARDEARRVGGAQHETAMVSRRRLQHDGSATSP